LQEAFPAPQTLPLRLPLCQLSTLDLGDEPQPLDAFFQILLISIFFS